MVHQRGDYDGDGQSQFWACMGEASTAIVASAITAVLIEAP
jgi:hypothetical protein